MIATIEEVPLLDDVDGLASMIVQSDVFERYQHRREMMREDETAQAMIRRFTRMKDRYDEVQRFGRYHPDYKTVVRQMRQLKRSVDLQPSIAAFKRAEKEVSDLLGKVSFRIARAVSESIKVPTGDPFFDRACGCGNGGTCGCRVR